MKRRIAVFIALCSIGTTAFFAISSCSTAKKFAAFDVNYSFPKVYFSYSAKAQKLPEFTLYTVKLSINMDSILSATHVPSGVINSAYLTKLAMVITAPPEATFNWIDSLKMQGYTDSTFLQPLLLGSASGIDPSAKTIDLALNKIDIKPILFKNSYYLRILVTPSGQIPASSISMYLDCRVKIHIEPL